MTAILTETPVATKVAVDAFKLRDALTACLLSTDKAKLLPILAAVQIVKAGGTLTLTSTDRYRLTRATITLADADFDEWTALIDKEDVKRLLTALPKKVARWTAFGSVASLTFNSPRLVLNTYESEVSAQNVEGTFPKVASVIDGETEAAEMASFNPAFMIDLCKMPGRDRNQPVRLSMNGPNKPVHSKWENNGVEYLHLIMQVRMAS